MYIEAVPCIESLYLDFENKNIFKLNLLVWNSFEFEIQNISQTQLNAELKTEQIYLSKIFNEYELLYINSDPNAYRKFICSLK